MTEEKITNKKETKIDRQTTKKQNNITKRLQENVGYESDLFPCQLKEFKNDKIIRTL
jgi:hypothetical protein